MSPVVGALATVKLRLRPEASGERVINGLSTSGMTLIGRSTASSMGAGVLEPRILSTKNPMSPKKPSKPIIRAVFFITFSPAGQIMKKWADEFERQCRGRGE